MQVCALRNLKNLFKNPKNPFKNLKNIFKNLKKSDQAASPVDLAPHQAHVVMARAEQSKGFICTKGNITCATFSYPELTCISE